MPSWPRRSPCGNSVRVETRGSRGETSAPTAVRAPAARPPGPPCRSRRESPARAARPRLRDVRPADHAGPIRPFQQVGLQPGQHDRPLLTQRLDRLPIRTGSALVRRHLQQRTVNRLATSSIVAGAAVPVVPIAFGAPARTAPSRSRVFLRVAPFGFSAVAIGRRAAPPFLRPGSPSLARRDSTRRAQRPLHPPSGTTRSSDFCSAISRRPLRPPAYRPTRPGPSRSPWVKR